MLKNFQLAKKNILQNRHGAPKPIHPGAKVGIQNQSTMADFKKSIQIQSIAVKQHSAYDQMCEMRRSIVEEQNKENKVFEEPVFNEKSRKYIVNKAIFAGAFGVTDFEYNQQGCPKVFSDGVEDKIKLLVGVKQYHCEQHGVVLANKIQRQDHIRKYHENTGNAKRKNGQIYKAYKDKSLRSLRNQVKKFYSDEEITRRTSRMPTYVCDLPLRGSALINGKVTEVTKHFDVIKMNHFDRMADTLMGGKPLHQQAVDNDVDTSEQQVEYASQLAVVSLRSSVEMFGSIEARGDTLADQIAYKLSKLRIEEDEFYKKAVEADADNEWDQSIQLASDGQHPLVHFELNQEADPTPAWQPAFHATVAGTPLPQPGSHLGPMFYVVNGGNPGVHADKGPYWQPDSVSAIDMSSESEDIDSVEGDMTMRQ